MTPPSPISGCCPASICLPADISCSTPPAKIVRGSTGGPKDIPAERLTPPAALHTNFKLAAEDGVLALHDEPRAGSWTLSPSTTRSSMTGCRMASARRRTAPAPWQIPRRVSPTMSSTPGWGGSRRSRRMSPTASTTRRSTVELATDTPGAAIWYTTDGSEPAEGRGQLYEGPLTIADTTVLRAVAAPGYLRQASGDLLLHLPGAGAAAAGDPAGYPATWGTCRGTPRWDTRRRTGAGRLCHGPRNRRRPEIPRSDRGTACWRCRPCRLSPASRTWTSTLSIPSRGIGRNGPCPSNGSTRPALSRASRSTPVSYPGSSRPIRIGPQALAPSALQESLWPGRLEYDGVSWLDRLTASIRWSYARATTRATPATPLQGGAWPRMPGMSGCAGRSGVSGFGCTAGMSTCISTACTGACTTWWSAPIPRSPPPISAEKKRSGFRETGGADAGILCRLDAMRRLAELGGWPTLPAMPPCGVHRSGRVQRLPALPLVRRR